MKRSAGVLMPIFSLDGNYGVGSFGKESYKFVDFLKSANQSVWQILPLGQTVYGDSPYQTTADKSFNPYFIDLDDLYNRGLLTKKDLATAKDKGRRIDYGKLYKERYALFKKAFSRFTYTEEFKAFKSSKEFFDYALFMTLKDEFKSLSNFPKEYKTRDKKALYKYAKSHEKEVDFYLFLQFFAKNQYFKLKKYANERGIKIMGDLPLYVALDSLEVWKAPFEFLLDENLAPKSVAGVPPDYFSIDGQLWGNPLYDYAEMRKDGYKWWKSRIRNALKRYDLLRIDHFRGLDRFWEIPYGKTAKFGRWVNADGREILKNFKNRLIAEDLGCLDDGVKDLLKTTGYPGMKVLLFAYNGDGENLYLPKNIGRNSVCYVGTHDNDTALGYAKSLKNEEFKVLKERVNASLPKGIEKVRARKDLAGALVELAYSTKADTAIISYADVLGKDNSYRINEPSTVGNWAVRFKGKDFSPETAERLKRLAEKYKRI